MKPTQEIIDELRKEAAHPPTPARVAGLFTEAADRIEHLYASGIHTCHADCQRPMCVLRRERDKALADLARVTAERDFAAKQVGVEFAECVAIRARVAELEHQLKSEIDARNGWWDNCKQAEQRNAELEEKAERYRLTTLRHDARAAELVAALRDMRDACKGEPAMNHQKYDALGIRVNNLLARAESATPAKFDFAAHDAAFVEWWSREGSGFHPAAIEDREEFTRRIANLAWIISANAARKQEAAR